MKIRAYLADGVSVRREWALWSFGPFAVIGSDREDSSWSTRGVSIGAVVIELRR
jgi:septin family protein